MIGTSRLIIRTEKNNLHFFFYITKYVLSVSSVLTSQILLTLQLSTTMDGLLLGLLSSEEPFVLADSKC